MAPLLSVTCPCHQSLFAVRSLVSTFAFAGLLALPSTVFQAISASWTRNETPSRHLVILPSEFPFLLSAPSPGAITDPS